MFEDEIFRLERLAIEMQVKYSDHEEVYNLAKALEQVCDEVGDTDQLSEENCTLQEEVNSLMRHLKKFEAFLKEREILEEFLKGSFNEDDLDLNELTALLRADSRSKNTDFLVLKSGDFTERGKSCAKRV